MVGLIDLAPTVLDLVGIPSPAAFDGTSLVPLMEGEDGGVRAVTYAWSLTTAPDGSTATLSAGDSATADLVPDVPGLYIARLVVNDGAIFLQSGAGIVADSDPEYEFVECNNKARALIEAIDFAREGID